MPLTGKRGLVIGIANDASIAYGCALEARRLGAELAVTYLNPKAERFVRPLAEDLGAGIIMPLDVQSPGQMEAVFEEVTERWGRLDFAIHSIAYCPADDLHGRVVDVSEEGFSAAMAVSCHSFLRMARLSEPLMGHGGTLITMSYHGAEKVVDHYGIMGPVKAALECAVRYAAAELGPKGIRVHAVSPGPIHTRAASGISNFDDLASAAATRAPGRRLVTIEEVGAACAFLVSDAGRGMTGQTIYVDGGASVVA